MQGSYVDTGLVEILKMFGIAVSDQYGANRYKKAVIITAQQKLSRYFELLTKKTAVQSNFLKHVTDYLGAEVCVCC